MKKYIDISIIEDWLTEQATIVRQGADPFSAGACIAYEKARMFLKTLSTRNIRQVLKEWSESPDGRASYEKVAEEMRAKMNEPQGLDEEANNYCIDIRLGYPRVMDETDRYIYNAFKAGAEWQKSQDFTHIDPSDDAKQAAVHYMEDCQEVDDFVRRDIDDIAERYFCAGAEWMAGQGAQLIGRIKVNGMGQPYLPPEYIYLSGLELKEGDKVIIQIRKKED